jgi:hypothetical protein
MNRGGRRNNVRESKGDRRTRGDRMKSNREPKV